MSGGSHDPRAVRARRLSRALGVGARLIVASRVLPVPLPDLGLAVPLPDPPGAPDAPREALRWARAALGAVIVALLVLASLEHRGGRP